MPGAASGFLLLAFTPLVLCACHPGAPAPLRVESKAARPPQDIEIETRGAVTLIHVHSPSGIGRAEATAGADGWPDRLVFRFYLRGLEELRFTCGDTTVVASVTSSGTGEVRERLAVGPGAWEEVLLSPDSPCWMPVHRIDPLPPSEGYFEAAIPAIFLRGTGRSFRIGWIDFYR